MIYSLAIYKPVKLPEINIPIFEMVTQHVT